MLKEFKKFALKGNMIDLAVGVIIGGGFNALVTSMVNDIIMPVISLFTGRLDFTNNAICKVLKRTVRNRISKPTGAPH